MYNPNKRTSSTSINIALDTRTGARVNEMKMLRWMSGVTRKEKKIVESGISDKGYYGEKAEVVRTCAEE